MHFCCYLYSFFNNSRTVWFFMIIFGRKVFNIVLNNFPILYQVSISIKKVMAKNVYKKRSITPKVFSHFHFHKNLYLTTKLHKLEFRMS